MRKILEKVERRLGEKLLLKGDRCAGPKCAFARRAYPPGLHGRSRKRKRKISEFGQMLQEKQKIRFFYGLDDQTMWRYCREAIPKTGIFSFNFFQMLESRLDNVLFRLGLTDSRRIARQLINHGHVLVGDRVVNIPSYQVKKGDKIAVKEKSLRMPIFANLEAKFKKYDPPQWLSIDKTTKTGAVLFLPEEGAGDSTFDFAKIKEFYSR